MSIGSDAVYAAEAYLHAHKQKTGTSSIEQISRVYGAQAVVISVDPKRVYVHDADEAKGHAIVKVRIAQWMMYYGLLSSHHPLAVHSHSRQSEHG